MPLRYAPYTIIQQINDNYYHLYFPSHLDIHNLINMSNLKLYEPPLSEEEVRLTHPTGIIPDFQ
jgi:hypothetical protein